MANMNGLTFVDKCGVVANGRNQVRSQVNWRDFLKSSPLKHLRNCGFGFVNQGLSDFITSTGARDSHLFFNTQNLNSRQIETQIIMIIIYATIFTISPR